MMKTGLAIDLGGTKCAGVLISSSGEILYRETLQVSGNQGGEVGIKVKNLIQKLVRQSINQDITVSGLCISVPGIVYQDTGRVWAPNIKGWEDYPLREMVEGITGIDFPVYIDNDRACSIFGEVWMGSAKKCKNAIYLAVGTGIGAGILADGNVLRGKRDIAGAVGWMALDSEYRPGYEQFGSFEYNASGMGLARVARDLLDLNNWEDSSLAHKDHLDAGIIFKAYEEGDPLALYVIENAIQYWGKAAANLTSLFDPEVIIFGGGVFGPGIILLDKIYEEALRWGQPVSMKEVKITASWLGQDAVLYGAGKIAMSII